METNTIPAPKCMMVTSKGTDCGKPAKARITGNVPVCGLHARAAEQRGSEIRPLDSRVTR